MELLKQAVNFIPSGVPGNEIAYKRAYTAHGDTASTDRAHGFVVLAFGLDALTFRDMLESVYLPTGSGPFVSER